MKRLNKIIISSLIVSLILLLNIVFAYFVYKEIFLVNNPVGFVGVDAHIYFDDGSTSKEAEEVVITRGDGSTFKKKGVYEVNLNDADALEHINNLRIDINIYSNIEVYFRVRIFTSTVMVVYNEVTNTTTEYTVTEVTPLKYANNWFEHNYNNENYIYYKDKAVKPENSDFLTIPLIDSYFGGDPIERSLNYLHLTIEVEAVQAQLGPQNNWNLPFKPWEEGDEEW